MSVLQGSFWGILRRGVGLGDGPTLSLARCGPGPGGEMSPDRQREPSWQSPRFCVSQGAAGRVGSFTLCHRRSRKVASWKVPIWGRAAGSQGPPGLAYNPAHLAESEEELKSFLVKEESEKVGLKLNIQKRKIIAFGSITSWQMDGETMTTGTDFIFLGFKIATEGDYSHESKRGLLLGRKAMTNLGSILKRRDVTLPTQFCLVKAMVFPVGMYGCESWIIKIAEH